MFDTDTFSHTHTHTRNCLLYADQGAATVSIVIMCMVNGRVRQPIVGGAMHPFAKVAGINGIAGYKLGRFDGIEGR